MIKWSDELNKQSFFYISPDVKRGLGLESLLPNYHIICSYPDPLIPLLRKQNANIFCTKEAINNSGKLLENNDVNDYIRRKSRGIPNILLFKPSLKTEILCAEKGYRRLVNNSSINKKYEDKISFHKLIRKIFPQNTIPSKIGLLGSFKFKDLTSEIKLPFVIQFALGWAGKTTFLIKEESEYKELIKRFPQTPVKISELISGFTVLNNDCIYRGKVFVSPPAFQVSGFSSLSSNPFASCGREWPVKFLTSKMQKIIYNLTQITGKIMAKDGYKGFFGLDFIVDENNGKVYLSENNARFTASTPFWTKMELGRNIVPLMAYHLAEFTSIGMNADYDVDSTISASQIIFRDSHLQPEKLGAEDFGVFKRFQNEWRLMRRGYMPEDLAADEIIFMKRKNVASEDGELSRIETKMSVARTPKSLQDWVKELL